MNDKTVGEHKVTITPLDGSVCKTDENESVSCLKICSFTNRFKLIFLFSCV